MVENSLDTREKRMNWKILSTKSGIQKKPVTTVDGGNPKQPPGMYKTL